MDTKWESNLRLKFKHLCSAFMLRSDLEEEMMLTNYVSHAVRLEID